MEIFNVLPFKVYYEITLRYLLKLELTTILEKKKGDWVCTELIQFLTPNVTLHDHWIVFFIKALEIVEH